MIIFKQEVVCELFNGMHNNGYYNLLDWKLSFKNKCTCYLSIIQRTNLPPEKKIFSHSTTNVNR